MDNSSSSSSSSEWCAGCTDKLMADTPVALSEFGSAVDVYQGYAIVGSPQDDLVGWEPASSSSSSGHSSSSSSPSSSSSMNSSSSSISSSSSSQHSSSSSSSSSSGHSSFSSSGSSSSSQHSSSSSTESSSSSAADDDKGSAYIFKFDCGGGVWCQDAKLTAPHPQLKEGFGRSVSIGAYGAAVAAVGEFGSGGPTSGSVYFYELNGGQWVLTQTLSSRKTLLRQSGCL